MRYIVPLIFLGVVAYYVFTMVPLFMKTPGNVWDRMLAAGKGSATKLWAKFVALVGAAAGALAAGAGFIGSPEVGDAIKQYMQPEYVAAAMVVIAFISQLARNRTL